MGEKGIVQNIFIQISWIEIYELRRRRHTVDKILVGDTIPLFFLILLNVLVVFLIFFSDER